MHCCITSGSQMFNIMYLDTVTLNISKTFLKFEFVSRFY
jgi:hypothetical protein